MISRICKWFSHSSFSTDVCINFERECLVLHGSLLINFAELLQVCRWCKFKEILPDNSLPEYSPVPSITKSLPKCENCGISSSGNRQFSAHSWVGADFAFLTALKKNLSKYCYTSQTYSVENFKESGNLDARNRTLRIFWEKRKTYLEREMNFDSSAFKGGAAE